MGAYWGSKYVAYLAKEIQECKVVQVDLIPDGSVGTSDRLIVPINEGDALFGHAQFDKPGKATLEVKRHILLKTGSEIQALLWAIEDAKQEIDLIRLTEPKSEENNQRIKLKQESISDFEETLKSLRKLRRSKVIIE